MDRQGKIVYEGTIKNNTTGEYNLPLKQKLAAGQYILRVNNNGTLQSSKVVVL